MFLDFLIYLPLRGLYGLLMILPFSIAMKLGKGLGWLLYRADKRHRLVTQSNLKKVWGEKKSPQELERIARDCFTNIGLSVADICRSSCLNKDNINQFTEVIGLENLDNALKRGKGVIAIGGHFGIWEILGVSMALRGYPCSAVVRPLDNVYLNGLVENYRTRHGNKVIHKKQALRKVLKCMRNNEIVSMIMDQNTAKREAVYSTFLGHPCYTLVAPVVLATKTNCALLPIFGVRQEKSKHKIFIEPEVVLEQTNDKERDLQVNTQKLNDIIGKYITKYPEQWLWLHRRWKV